MVMKLRSFGNLVSALRNTLSPFSKVKNQRRASYTSYPAPRQSRNVSCPTIIQCFEHLFIGRTRSGGWKTAESFIYRRQIDSLSNQSARATRELLSCSYFLASLMLFLILHRHLLPALLSGPLFFRATSWNKQLLSTFRPAKWEKAAGAFNFPRVWRVLQGSPLRKCKVGVRHTAISLPPLTSRWRWRKRDATGCTKLRWWCYHFETVCTAQLY